MYEDITFDSLMKRMLARVPSDIDKREGSVIWDALAPAAIELKLMYIELDVILNESFADTESRPFLIRRAAERGLSPKEATYAVLKGEFNIDVAIGSRFSLDDLNYAVTEKISNGIFKLQCETAGTAGNKKFGRLIPINYIKGLETAKLTELLIPGEDEEDTEVFRQRYLRSFDQQAFGGNKADYKEKVGKMQGVGGLKVYRATNSSLKTEAGHIALFIINSEFQKPSTEMIKKLQTAIDPTTNTGDGIGVAPIDHQVHVFAVNESELTISTNIVYADGYNLQEATKSIKEIINEYFLELNKSWADSDTIMVRISYLESRLLDYIGIVDIYDTKINGVASNYRADTNSIVKFKSFADQTGAIT